MTSTAPGAVLVTGAARRIGRAIALDLGRSGWSVAVHYHDSKRAAHEVVEELTAAGSRAVALRADLGREEQRLTLVPAAAEALGSLTCLINNASVFENDRVGTATRQSWDKHMEINLRAPFVLIQHFAAQLENGAAGNVINVLDERVWNLTTDFASYTLSKSALWTLTRTLALALAPGVRVNGIGPGPTLPNRRQTDEDFAKQWASTPLGRGTTPEEICQAVRFILAAPAMTGQMIALDGGQHLSWAPAGGRSHGIG